MKYTKNDHMRVLNDDPKAATHHGAIRAHTSYLSRAGGKGRDDTFGQWLQNGMRETFNKDYELKKALLCPKK